MDCGIHVKNPSSPIKATLESNTLTRGVVLGQTGSTRRGERDPPKGGDSLKPAKGASSPDLAPTPATAAQILKPGVLEKRRAERGSSYLLENRRARQRGAKGRHIFPGRD